MNFLAIDFETQCDKVQTTRITEVGAAYGVSEHKIQSGSWLCHEPDYPPQTAFIAELTGISDDMLKADGKPRKEILLTQLFPLMEASDIIFAHKKSFDQVVFESTCKALGLKFPVRPWVCTLTEFPWPEKFTCKKLGHLAFEHGLFDPPLPGYAPDFDRKELHRAGDDAKLLLTLIFKKYDVTDVLAYAKEPWVYLRADVIKPWTDGGVSSGFAKQLGFMFERCKGTDGPSFPRMWVARVKQRNYPVFLEKFAALGKPFAFQVITGLS